MLALFGVCSARLRRRLWQLGVPMLSFVLVRVPAEAARRACFWSCPSCTVLPLMMDARGCECWSLTEKLIKRLEVFHHQCVRAMCRVTRKHTWERHIKMSKLLGDLGLQPIRFYVFKSQLGWFGHVCRMGFERIPRCLLSCWVRNPRPIGAPKFTYGRTVKKALVAFGIKLKNTEEWQPLVVDRAAWKAGTGSDINFSDAAATLRQLEKPPPPPASAHIGETLLPNKTY